MNTKRQEALVFAKKLREAILDESKKVSTLLIGCKTICTYLGTLEENNWIQDEIQGYDQTKFKSYGDQLKLLPKYREVGVIFFDLRNNPILMDGKTSELLSSTRLPLPVSQLEDSDHLTISSGPALDFMNYICTKNNYPHVYKAIISSNHIQSVLNGIKNRISEFLDKTIIELEFGAIPEEIFNNIRREVDSKLVSMCPDAINKLEVTYENIVTGTSSESWSYVATSCRRIINDVADALFPAQSKPFIVEGQEHSVKQDKYVNRILAAIMQSKKSKSENKLTSSMFQYTDAFLRNIQSYASKGDHSEFTKTEATRCLVYTYLLLGDILEYYTNEK